jgi:hypothetical protein
MEWADLLERIEAEQAELRSKGITRIGGVFHWPDYVGGYIEAARRLVPEAITRAALTMPCFYLQRHALELAIKLLRDEAADVVSARASIAASERAQQSVYVKPERFDFIHRFDGLLGQLTGVLEQCELAVPEEIRALAIELHAFEGDDETRARYAKGKPKGPFAARSYPEVTEFHLEKWQAQLEQIGATIALLRDDPVGPLSLRESIRAHFRELDDALVEWDLC